MKKLLFILLFCINLFGEDRIVTLSPSINEIVYALDKGNLVVANTNFCDFPESSKEVKKIGGYSSISIEKILEVNPSVVIGQNYDEKLISNLKALNINVMDFKTNTLDNIKNTIQALGTFFNEDLKAKELISNIDNSLVSLDNITKDKKILFVISPNKSLANQIYVTGNFLYFEDIIKASGNQNAYNSTNKSQPVVNAEKIIAMNPDIIILLGAFFEGKEKELEEVKNAWRSLPINAARNDNIYAIDKEYSGIPSHRVQYFIDDFKKILENVRNK